jgi:hypothetical protein
MMRPWKTQQLITQSLRGGSASEEMERLLCKCGGGNPELTANTQETLREWRAKLMSENYGWWCVWRVCVCRYSELRVISRGGKKNNFLHRRK